MAGTSGAIIARIVSQYSNAGTKAAERDLKKFGAGIDKWAKRAAKAFAVVAAAAIFMAVKIGKQAVAAASNLNESISKATVIFADSADQIIEWSKTTADAMGQSRTQAIDAASTFAMFAKAAGLASTETVAWSTQLTALASDMASMSNTSPEEAINAISSAFRGQMKPISSYNVFLSDLALRQEAATMGIYSGTGALTAQQKILSVYSLLLQNTTEYQGDFARTSDQLANSTRQVTANFENAKAELGTKLLPVVLRFARLLLDEVIPAIEEWVGKNGDKLANAFANAAGALITFAYFVKNTFELISNNVGMFQLLASILGAMWATAKLILFVEAIMKMVKAYKLLRTAAITAAGANALLTGGISVGMAAAGILAFSGAVLAMNIAINKVEDKFNESSKAVEDSTSLFKGADTAAQDYSSVLKGLNIVLGKTAAKTTKLTKVQVAQAKAEKVLAKLKKLGIKPTNELDPIQLEAARLNLMKQGNLEEMGRLNAILANLEAQLKTNVAIQRYADLLGVVADTNISNEEIALLAGKWGLTRDEVVAYISSVFAVNNGKISQDEVSALAAQWGVTKDQARMYLEFFRALNDGKLTDTEITNLATKWNLSTQKVTEYAKQIASGTTATDLWAKPGDAAKKSWDDALASLNAYLARSGVQVSKAPPVGDPVPGNIASPFPINPNAPKAGDPGFIGPVPVPSSSVTKAIASISPSLFDSLGSLSGRGQLTLPALASGGIVNSPTIAMIGEGGPEAVIPLSGNSMGGMNVTVNVGGSIISEGDLVASIRNALLQGQNNGQAILNTAVNI